MWSPVFPPACVCLCTAKGAAQQTMEAASAPPNSMVTIMIKNPNGSDQDFSLEVPLADTAIADVKRMLHEKHPEHPEPSTQRLIFAGKLLVDDSLTADVLKQVSSPLTPPTRPPAAL